MSISDPTRPIVVAVDGSDSALDATRWAAGEAQRRGRGLRIVHTYAWPLPAYRPGFADMTALHDAIQENAATVLRDAETAVADVAPGLHPETEASPGSVTPVLREISAHAALLVLGSRGLGGFTGLLVGSVAVALAAHALCPVVVVRGSEHDRGGPVVVGVDGSAASQAAVALAFEEAATRRCDLVAVHASIDSAFPVTPAGGFYPGWDWTALTDQATATLVERLAGWQEKYPDVPVRRVVEQDRPARALLNAARDAQLLVVGSRGRGGFAGLMLGSVSQAMIQHAPCPVMIARSDTA
jgi:nucleotide-binding universal stress UspA family protein